MTAEATAGRQDRFLTRPMGVAFAVYGLFALTFSAFQVKGDALVYFNLLRRFFGEHPDSSFAYQFGSDVWNWPFFLVGKLLGTIFGQNPKIFHVSFEEISMTFAAQTAFVLTLYLTWRLLRELDLPRGPGVLFLTTFGSPLFYYVIFEPAGKHVVDTLILTAAALALLYVLRDGGIGPALVLGALAGVSLNTRYVNVAFFFVLGVALALRRRRELAVAIPTAAAFGGVVFALPALRGISYFVPSYFPKSQALAIGSTLLVGDTRNPLNGFDPLIPLKMLFSLHRGLFLWTPLTAFAVIGFVFVLRRRWDDTRRVFLSTLGLAALALLCIHSVWGAWDGGFAFSTRFLTGLFPLFAIGIAELRRRAGALLYVVLVPCVAWALLIAFAHNIGYDNVSAKDGINRVAQAAYDGRDPLRHRIDRRAVDRWRYLWGLAHGRDPEHVHGP
jgi:hypothetical protein